MVFGDAPAAMSVVAAILGGALAASSHVAKTGGRALINTSPEPFTNWAASFGEDVGVGVLLYLAFVHPFIALAVVIVLLVLAIWLIPNVWRLLRRLFSRIAGGSPPHQLS